MYKNTWLFNTNKISHMLNIIFGIKTTRGVEIITLGLWGLWAVLNPLYQFFATGHIIIRKRRPLNFINISIYIDTQVLIFKI